MTGQYLPFRETRNSEGSDTPSKIKYLAAFSASVIFHIFNPSYHYPHFYPAVHKLCKPFSIVR